MEHASTLLAVYNGERRGGTAATMRYAQKMGREIIVIDPAMEEIINIQPAGNKAKPYQVKQVRSIILKYRLGGDLHEI